MTPIDANRSQNWQLRKPAAHSAGGVVVSQNAIAAEIGAAVLRDGGNAIDAAIATSFAVSVVEPWMSGLGGGGYMLVYLAAEDRVRVIDFGMVAPRELDLADYPLVEGALAGDLFTWPAVLENRNFTGYHSVATPTQVDGIALAHQRFASMDWASLIAPAIELADAGLPINWFSTIRIAGSASDLGLFPASRDLFLADGLPKIATQGAPPPLAPLDNLAATLRRLAEAGPRDFYEGEISAKLVADMRAGGSKLTADDLATYHATECDPLQVTHGDAEVFAAPGLTAGPTLADTLARFAGKIPTGSPPGPETYAAWAGALKAAYETRLASMGDVDDSRDPASTTHLTTIDGDGNMVTLTQTLLSAFGSKVVLPETGILMNNGIMWFDPRPGAPNSLAPGKRPLSNMCPAIVRRPDGFGFALGASGGRRIMPAVMQLISMMVDCGMDLEDAMHHPRIDVSGGETANADLRLDDAARQAISSVLPVVPVEDSVYPSNFACPNVVMNDPTRTEKMGAAYPMYPLSGAIGA